MKSLTRNFEFIEVTTAAASGGGASWKVFSWNRRLAPIRTELKVHCQPVNLLVPG